MTPYDAAMAGLVIAGMVWGAFRGITWQLASILSLVLGYTAAQPLSAQVAPYFPGEPVVARALAMIAVYVAVSGGVFLGAWLVRATLRRLQFEAYDRHLGMLLGGVEGLILGLVATLFVVSLAPQTRDPIFTSPTGRVVGSVMGALGPVLPAEARGVLAPFLQAGGAGSAEVAGSGSVAGETPEPPAPSRRFDPVAIPAPAPRTASRAASAPAPAPETARDRDRDREASPASFRDLVEESQRRIGQAVIEGASEGLRRAAQGEPVPGPGQGQRQGQRYGSDRAVERR